MRQTPREHPCPGSIPRLLCWNLPPLPELDPPSPVDCVGSLRVAMPVTRLARRMVPVAGIPMPWVATDWPIDR